MAVQAIRDLTGRSEGIGSSLRSSKRADNAGNVDHSNFGDLVKSFARDVNDLQFQAGHAVDMLATGQAGDVHQVMIAVQEAGIALDLMLEIRNRVLEGYQDLIRMQV